MVILQPKKSTRTISLFYSYSHIDEDLRRRLEVYLRQLKYEGMIDHWHDRRILPGTNWSQAIDEAIWTADVILLLITPNFLASSYCNDIELQTALERQKRGEAYVIPIILSPCDWQNAPFAHLQFLPKDGKAVTTWKTEEEGFQNVVQGLRRTIKHIKAPHRRSTPERQNQLRLLRRVQATWVEGVLEQSLHQAAMIRLNLQERPDALTNPWQMQVQETHLAPQTLPADTSITQIYDEADGGLLILGEPGSGKTTMLLELARFLLERAEHNAHHQLPVVLNLSSWAERRPALVEWLVNELRVKYQVPRRVASDWVIAEKLLLLLDGLDEVTPAHRSACLQMINMYQQEHVNVPIVICCRSEEYNALPVRLQGTRAVQLLPLTAPQIDHYLEASQGKLEGVRHLLAQDAIVREMATTPFILSILTLTYMNNPTVTLSSGESKEKQRDAIFDTYVDHMLAHRSKPRTATPMQFRQRLMFLAQQIRAHHQTEFYFEQLQPDWLTNEQIQHRYQLVRLLGGSLVGALYGLANGLVVGLLFMIITWNFRFLFMLMGLIFGLLIGAVIGLLFGFGKFLIMHRSQKHDQIQPAEVLLWSHSAAQSKLSGKLADAQYFGLAVGLLGGLIYTLIQGSPQTLNFELYAGFVVGITGGLIVGLGRLLIALSRLLFIHYFKKQQPQSNPTVSPQARTRRSSPLLRWLKNKILFGLGGGILSGLIYGLFGGIYFIQSSPHTGNEPSLLVGLIGGGVYGLFGGVLIGLYRMIFGRRSEKQNQLPSEEIRRETQQELWSNLVRVLICAIAGSLLGWLINLGESGILLGWLAGLTIGWLSTGITTKRVTDRTHLAPGEGIWRSAKNGLIPGFVIEAISIVMLGLFGLPLGLADGQFGMRLFIFALFLGISFGLIIGLIFALLLGLEAFSAHFLLRYRLARSHHLPWRLKPFLDEAAERLLLHKIGGGYIFAHRLLLDYFAAQGEQALIANETHGAERLLPMQQDNRHPNT
jgi:hypothetical protein